MKNINKIFFTIVVLLCMIGCSKTETITNNSGLWSDIEQLQMDSSDEGGWMSETNTQNDSIR